MGTRVSRHLNLQLLAVFSVLILVEDVFDFFFLETYLHISDSKGLKSSSIIVNSPTSSYNSFSFASHFFLFKDKGMGMQKRKSRNT